MKPKVITVPEAGEQLGLSKSSAYEAAKRGDIPTIRIGRRLLVPCDAVDRLLSQAFEKAKTVAAAAAIVLLAILPIGSAKATNADLGRQVTIGCTQIN
jgi:excisionase family DNA binding protein